ncbi:methylenetetrahydrofolate reductase C-terminal domain-containing protein [Microbacterium sp. NPDC076911]|uniref:methylenetetrahydrofolate reductase C-terminal domain-containing protein n=1 Tax=Microbacterium sp. NPDC076911 TaxID=3154958 RepID=UPI00343BAE38
MSAATEACAKRMVYGPCGGVRANGTCEVADTRCSFLDAPVRAWSASDLFISPVDGLADLRTQNPGHHPSAARFAQRTQTEFLVTADLTAKATTFSDLQRASETLGESLTAVVAGEAPGVDSALAPSHRAALLRDLGLRVIAGITCRDRNRVALEGELAALADLGVEGVLALTGDHPLSTLRASSKAVFDLDSTRLAALAHRAGHFVAVAEQPAAPPQHSRADRLVQKVRAGAELCFVNLCGDAQLIAHFQRSVAAHQSTIPLVPVVPIIASASAAERLASLPGITLPPTLMRAVAEARHPEREGIEQAIILARQFADIAGVAGVHLSAVGVPDDADGVRSMALVNNVATALREEQQ